MNCQYLLCVLIGIRIKNVFHCEVEKLHSSLLAIRVCKKNCACGEVLPPDMVST